MSPIEIAQKFLNQSELKNNRFVDDPEVVGDLGELLHKAGQKDGEAWCAYLMEVVFCEAYPDRESRLRKLFSASAKQTFENFEKAGYKIVHYPVMGALVIWTKYIEGVEQWTGHAGIVVDVVTTDTFKSIEGNTSAEGSREGTIVGLNGHSTKLKRTGLNVKGFVII